jgi:hypothetical protein
MSTLVADIKAFCLAEYEAGYDTCVECWDAEDYVEFVADHDIESIDDFKKAYAPVMDRRREIENTAF